MKTDDPQYLHHFVQGLQQQRNQANDTVAHLAAVLATKDQQIAALTAQVEELKKVLSKAEPPLPAPRTPSD